MNVLLRSDEVEERQARPRQAAINYKKENS
jgi:hypothetical protein